MWINMQKPKQWSLRKVFIRLYNVQSVRQHTEGRIIFTMKMLHNDASQERQRKKFKKEYLPNLTEEIFTISKRITKERLISKLTNDSGEFLEGSFYEKDLQKVIKEHNIFRIDSILRKKKRGKDTFLLVKWKGPGEVQ